MNILSDLLHINSIQLLGVIFSLILLITVTAIVRERKMQEKYSIIWFFISFFVLFFSLFRGVMEWFSELVGIYYAPSAFFSILISCAYVLLLNMSMVTSSIKKQNKNLIQEIGLLKLQIDEMEKKIKESEEKLNI